MWYVVEMLFAQPPTDSAESAVCEQCDVLFEAPSALAAYQKGIAWATNYADNPAEQRFVGIENVRSLNEPPGDGVEVGGGFFESDDVWDRLDELPAPEDIVEIRAEFNPETKVGDLLNEQKRRIWDRLSEGDS